MRGITQSYQSRRRQRARTGQRRDICMRNRQPAASGVQTSVAKNLVEVLDGRRRKSRNPDRAAATGYWSATEDPSSKRIARGGARDPGMRVAGTGNRRLVLTEGKRARARASARSWRLPRPPRMVSRWRRSRVVENIRRNNFGRSASVATDPARATASRRRSRLFFTPSVVNPCALRVVLRLAAASR